MLYAYRTLLKQDWKTEQFKYTINLQELVGEGESMLYIVYSCEIINFTTIQTEKIK